MPGSDDDDRWLARESKCRSDAMVAPNGRHQQQHHQLYANVRLPFPMWFVAFSNKKQLIIKTTSLIVLSVGFIDTERTWVEGSRANHHHRHISSQSVQSLRRVRPTFFTPGTTSVSIFLIYLQVTTWTQMSSFQFSFSTRKKASIERIDHWLCIFFSFFNCVLPLTEV